MCRLLSGNGEPLVACVLLDLRVVFIRLSAAVKKYSLKLFVIVGESRIIFPLVWSSDICSFLLLLPVSDLIMFHRVLGLLLEFEICLLYCRCLACTINFRQNSAVYLVTVF